MKIKINTGDLRMVVLKQIVANASMGMKVESNMNFIDWVLPFTPKKLKLKRLRKRSDKLQQFETALRVSKSEFVDIDYQDVDFIYKGFPS